MTRRIRTTLFEEELRSSKPRSVHSKSNVLYKRNSSKNSGSGSASTKSNRGSKVVVKITGGSKDSKSAGRHLDYISRNNELNVYDKNGDIIDFDELKMNSEMIIMADRSRSDAKKTVNIMFSTEGKNDPESLKKAVLETAKENLDGYEYYLALHEDTENTHCHLVVYSKSLEGKKRFSLRKSKLNSIKKSYSENLNKNGIRSYFESHSDKFSNNKAKNLHSFKERIVQEFKVVDHGIAPYKFQDGANKSYFLFLENKNGVKKQHWSWGLKRELEINNVKNGDYIKLKKMGVDENGQSKWSIQKEESKEFQVVDFGKSAYRFTENEKDSFFMLLKNNDGEIKQIWNKKLEGFIKKSDLKKGDTINLSDNNAELLKEITQKQNIVQENKLQNGGIKL